MRKALDSYFTENYYTSVVALQINLRQLPDTFNNAITQSLLMKQEIQRVENLRKTVEVQQYVSKIIVMRRQKSAYVRMYLSYTHV